MIGQLLEMARTPISLEFKVTPARREIQSQGASYDMQRQAGGLDISHQYPKINIDTSEARASMELKSPSRSGRDSRDESLQAGREATEQFAEEGSAFIMDTSGRNVMGDMIAQRMASKGMASSEMGFLPSVPANIDWQPHQLDMRYEMDRLNFDWRTHKPEVQFTPAQVEYMVKEYPKLEIRYIGKPLYVPPSASPDYVPTELDITA